MRPATTSSGSGWSGSASCRPRWSPGCCVAPGIALARRHRTNDAVRRGAITAPHHDDRSARRAGYDDETVNADRRGIEPPVPRLDAGRLWACGAASAVVAALIALVGVLVI